MTKPLHRIYVAGPIGEDPAVWDARQAQALDVAQMLRDARFAPFVPHLYLAWHRRYPRKDWLDLDLAWLAACDGVLRLPGPSDGADEEVRTAFALGQYVVTLRAGGDLVEAVRAFEQERERRYPGLSAALGRLDTLHRAPP